VLVTRENHCNNKSSKLSKNNSFSATTASRYSLALYELSDEENSLEEIESHSNLFLKLIQESEDFNSLIKDPTNSVEDLNNVLSKIAEMYNLNKLLTKFLSFLISKRRFFFVQLILQDFVNTCSKKRGEVKAELISSKELSNDQIDKIKNDLSQNFNSKIKLDYKFDKSLIGGLIIQVGSIMVDTSIKNKLQQIENKMIEA
jgi:ATP synthase, F1 delta subunit